MNTAKQTTTSRLGDPKHDRAIVGIKMLSPRITSDVSEEKVQLENSNLRKNSTIREKLAPIVQSHPFLISGAGVCIGVGFHWMKSKIPKAPT